MSTEPSKEAKAKAGRLARARWRKAQSDQESMNAVLSQAAVEKCRELIPPRWPVGKGPIMLSYATAVSPTWLLGLSAAAHGLPLAIAGLGMPGWYWWEGGRKQLPGSRRSLQVLDAVSPDVPIMLTDHGDIGAMPSLSIYPCVPCARSRHRRPHPLTPHLPLCEMCAQLS